MLYNGSELSISRIVLKEGIHRVTRHLHQNMRKSSEFCFKGTITSVAIYKHKGQSIFT